MSRCRGVEMSRCRDVQRKLSVLTTHMYPSSLSLGCYHIRYLRFHANENRSLLEKIISLQSLPRSTSLWFLHTEYCIIGFRTHQRRMLRKASASTQNHQHIRHSHKGTRLQRSRMNIYFALPPFDLYASASSSGLI